MLSELRVGHLKEKAKVVKERENYQKMLMFLQQDNQHLRQQLLEAPKHSKFDVDSAADDVQDSVHISTPSSATSGAQPMEYQQLGAWDWLGCCSRSHHLLCAGR